MHDVLTTLVVALVGAAVVAIPGAIAHRMLRGRSITAHICLLLIITLLTAYVGIVAVAKGMFIEGHDLNVLGIVLAVTGVISLTIGIWLGRRLAHDAMWADEARARERTIEASRRDL